MKSTIEFQCRLQGISIATIQVLKTRNTTKKIKPLLIKKAFRYYLKAFGNNVAATYSPGSNPSTIGAAGLNFSVRDGKRWDPCARPPNL